MSDEELMRRYQKGDFAAFQALYHRFAPRLFGYLRKRERDPQAQEDIFQKVLLKLHRSREAYDSEIPFMAWLFTIAHSVAVDHFRASRRQAGMEPLPENLGQAEEGESVEANIPLEKLRPEDRALLESRYWNEESFSKIAQRLELSEAGVRKRVSRALRALRKKMTGAST